jgi:glyoxylase-like metal-dependent hydrolase (beta-lactamase superfamily II)
MVINTLPVGPLGCNCSILVDSDTSSAVVIDPGGDFDEIRARLEQAGAKVSAILHTHAHVDHVGATAPLQKWTGAEAHLHEADRFLYGLIPMQAQLIGVEPPPPCEMVGDLDDGKVLRAGSLELAVIHTPGHSPGSVCLVARDGGRAIVFTGDTLFRRGIGRTDLWGGDTQALFRSIRGPLFDLDDTTLVIPGHGPETTIGEERRGNPYLPR